MADRRTWMGAGVMEVELLPMRSKSDICFQLFFLFEEHNKACEPFSSKVIHSCGFVLFSVLAFFLVIAWIGSSLRGIE
jgi:hypothetical protein